MSKEYIKRGTILAIILRLQLFHHLNSGKKFHSEHLYLFNVIATNFAFAI